MLAVSTCSNRLYYEKYTKICNTYNTTSISGLRKQSAQGKNSLSVNIPTFAMYYKCPSKLLGYLLLFTTLILVRVLWEPAVKRLHKHTWANQTQELPFTHADILTVRSASGEWHGIHTAGVKWMPGRIKNIPNLNFQPRPLHMTDMCLMFSKLYKK